METERNKSIAASLRDTFEIDKYLLFSHGGWCVSVRPAQHTPGALILSLVRDCLSLGDLRKDEMIGFGQCVSRIERLLREALNPQKFNYFALMMVDPQVHFHVIPRFSGEVQIGRRAWLDRDWPGPANLAKLHDELVSPSEIRELLLGFSPDC